MNEFSRSEKEIYDQRKKKLEQIQEIDSKSLPHAFTTSTTLSFIRREYKDLEPGAKTDVNVIVAGRVINHRSFGKLIFIDIQDNTEKIQLLIDKESIKKEAMKIIELLDVGDIIGCHGEVITTKKGELSVKISKVQLLNKALRGLPEKWHGLKDKETRFRNRYLDFISNSSAKNIILIRSIIVQVIRKYLDEKDFIEVETPILQPTPGGAIAKPFETPIKPNRK